MAGGELFNRIKNRANNPYTEREAATYIKMLVEAICHLHSMDIVSFILFNFLLLYILLFLLLNFRHIVCSFQEKIHL